MPRKKSKAVPGVNCPVPQHTSGLSRITMETLRRIMPEADDKTFNKSDDNLHRMPDLSGMLIATNERLTGLKHEARQPRLATETDVETNTKFRERTEGATAADRAKHIEDSSSARTRGDDGPTSLTNFGKIAEPPLAPKKCILVTPWLTKALKHQSRIFHPWRCTCYHPPPTARRHNPYNGEDHPCPAVSLERLPDRRGEV